jgi:hypothetical protein
MQFTARLVVFTGGRETDVGWTTHRRVLQPIDRKLRDINQEVSLFNHDYMTRFLEQ